MQLSIWKNSIYGPNHLLFLIPDLSQDIPEER